MFQNRAAAVALIIAATALVGCGRGGSASIQTTPAGVYYTPWTGGLFKIEDGKLVEVPRGAGALTAPKTLQFSEKIPGVSGTGFPVVVTGAVKFSDGQRRLKIDLALGPLGNKQPSISDQATFIAGLRDGSGKLKSLSLSFLDSDGFLASEDKLIPISGSGWTGETAAGGAATQYQYLATEASSPSEDRSTASVDVKWSQPADVQVSSAAIDAARAAEQAAADASAAAAMANPSPPDPSGGGGQPDSSTSP